MKYYVQPIYDKVIKEKFYAKLIDHKPKLKLENNLLNLNIEFKFKGDWLLPPYLL